MIIPKEERTITMDKAEKLNLQCISVTIKFEPFLTCSTQDCTREATVGSASYDKSKEAWMLIPICKHCTMRMAKSYGVDLDLDKD
jgi:hypothetical protein